MNVASRLRKMAWSWRAGLFVTAASVALAGASGRAAEPQAAGKTRHWEGTLKVRPGLELRLVVNVTTDARGGTVATLDSPDERLEGLKLDPFALDRSALAFELKLTKAKYEGKLNKEGTEAVGTWSQRGLSLPLTFRPTTKPTAVPKIVGPEQIWEGKIELQAGLALRVVLHVGKDAAGKLLATFDSPDQGAKRLKVDTVALDKEKLTFEMKRILGRFEGTLNKGATEAKGTWTQSGFKLPLTLKRTAKVTELRRPQTPKPPFPYAAVDVTYPNKAGGITLAATLTVPQGKGPFPAVLLISGSGSQDRDETIFEHKPFAVLADALTRRGVAVLRIDDRGVGGTTGSPATATTEDFAGDVLAGVAFLKTRPEIDGRKIGLMGHSEGGIIAPLVATRSKDVAFIVLLAGTGLPGEEIIRLQSRAIGLAMVGNDKDKQAALLKQLEYNKRLMAVAKMETDETKADAKMKAIIGEMKASLSEKERKELGEAEGLLDSELKSLRTPWFRYFLTYDPRPALTKVHCPVLAVIGEKDLQVPPKENLAEIEKALKQGGNTHVTVKQLAGVNHLFQTCKTGVPSEYTQIEETIAPSALKEIGDWIVGQTRGK
jgi:pimeloyl-ACP methyl ester carboxylesterase